MYRQFTAKDRIIYSEYQNESSEIQAFCYITLWAYFILEPAEITERIVEDFMFDFYLTTDERVEEYSNYLFYPKF